MAGPVLEINVVSDVVCPWCFIGKRQLDQALADWQAHPGAVAPQVRWFPFQLNPDMASAGQPRADYLAAKFGSADPLAIYARLRAAAGEVGLDLALERITRQPNTLKALALIDLAAEAGLQPDMAEALFRAFFQQGRDLGDTATLRELAQGVGLNDELIEGALNVPEVAERVARTDADLREQGVQGVPLFVIGRAGEPGVAVEGAQGAQALLEAMQQAVAAA